jgi:hypothetical protein
MSWLDKPIREGIRRGIEKGFADAFAPGGVATKVIHDRLGVDLPDDAPMTEVQFLVAMAQRFAQAGVKTPAECRALARNSLAAFLADEKIEFGDPEYGWDRGCAHIVAEEMEIEHWERTA